MQIHMPEVQFTDDPPRWLLSSLRAQPTTNLAAVDLAIAALACCGALRDAQRTRRAVRPARPRRHGSDPRSWAGIPWEIVCAMAVRIRPASDELDYSNRSARTGSTRAARRAGIQHAPRATNNNSPATVEMVSGSFAEIP